MPINNPGEICETYRLMAVHSFHESIRNGRLQLVILTNRRIECLLAG
jgi:hypothetical protein